MLAGNNEIRLNQATVILALQHYFDTVLFAEGRSPKIVSVAAETSTSYDSRSGMFSVKTTMEQPA